MAEAGTVIVEVDRSGMSAAGKIKAAAGRESARLDSGANLVQMPHSDQMRGRSGVQGKRMRYWRQEGNV